MSVRNTRLAWGWPHRLLHWATAVVILFQIGVGLYAAEIVDDVSLEFRLAQTHKSWGAVAFAIALLRIVWRWANPRPDYPASMSRLRITAAEGTHLALYVLMVLLPVSGWLMASASPLQDEYGLRNMVFGVVELPDPLVPGSAALTAMLRSVHLWASACLVVIVAAHGAAALCHELVFRDGLLRRITTGSSLQRDRL